MINLYNGDILGIQIIDKLINKKNWHTSLQHYEKLENLLNMLKIYPKKYKEFMLKYTNLKCSHCHFIKVLNQPLIKNSKYFN